MLRTKRLALTCILSLTLCFFNVNAHQVPDPGPNVIKGDATNLGEMQGVQWDYRFKLWGLTDRAEDSLNNAMLTAFVSIQKNIHMNIAEIEWATTGIATARVWAAGIAEGVATSRDYYIKAQGRGKLWNRSKKKSSSYTGGCNEIVDKSAARISACPTWSGVHMRGRAKVDNQFDEVEAEFEWK